MAIVKIVFFLISSKLGSKNVGSIFSLSPLRGAKKENLIKTGSPHAGRGSRLWRARTHTCTPCSQHTSRAHQIQNQTACAFRRAFFREVSRIVVAFGNLCCSVLAILTSLSSKKKQSEHVCAARPAAITTTTTTRGLCLKTGFCTWLLCTFKKRYFYAYLRANKFL